MKKIIITAVLVLISSVVYASRDGIDLSIIIGGSSSGVPSNTIKDSAGVYIRGSDGNYIGAYVP